MNGHILVAVGPNFSEAALSTAVEKARETGARLTVLHVIDESPWWAGPYAEGLCDTQAIVHQFALAIRRHSETVLNQAAIEFDWQARSMPRDGHSIGRVIARTANTLGVDLVILGARRRTLLAMGMHPVRNVVCRHSNCEVVIAAESAPASARVILFPPRLHDE
jgi:nucleotide-binding universal stress UspA family protein